MMEKKRQRLLSAEEASSSVNEEMRLFLERGLAVSLVQHLLGGLSTAVGHSLSVTGTGTAAAAALSAEELQRESTALALSLLCSLLETRSEWTNKQFAESGAELVKAMAHFQSEISPSATVNNDCLTVNEPTPQTEERENDGRALSSLSFRGAPLTLSLSLVLSLYREHLSLNRSVYEHITTHHAAITEQAWDAVREDTDALARYRNAAQRMGEKPWVHECNRHMALLCVKFFREGGAVRHYLRRQREAQRESEKETVSGGESRMMLAKDALLADENENNNDNNENNNRENCSSGEQAQEAQNQKKIRLLDVGSCYNPIARFEDSLSSQFDVMALDLCPSHPSVLQADFLSLFVTAKDSQPVVIENNTVENKDEAERASAAASVQSLPAESFDATTMSLVLSYLPTPEAREKMITTARALLRSPSSNSNSLTPHRTGLLVIVEKQSILASPAQQHQRAQKVQKNTKETKDTESNNAEGRAVTVEDWKRAICSRGFSCVSYQFLPTSDGRKSHVFAFAAEDLSKIELDPELHRLWIKHDFQPHPDASPKN